MKTIISIFLLLYCTLIAQDKQVFWNTNKKISIINNEINKQYNIFPEYPNLVEAKLFQKDSISFYTDILVLDTLSLSNKISKSISKDEINIINEKLKSSVLVSNFSEKVADTLNNKNKLEKSLWDSLDQTGRYTLLWGTTLSTMFIHAPIWIFGLGIDFDSGASLTGTTYLASTAIGYGLPSLLVQNNEITKAEAELSLMGLNFGVVNTALLGFSIDNNFINFSGSNRFKPELLILSIGGIAQAVQGYQFAKRKKLTHGEAELLINSNVSGVVNGFLLYYLAYSAINSFDKNNEFFVSEYNINAACATALVSGAAKSYFAYQSMKKYNYTTADVTTISYAGLLGYAWGGYFCYELINAFENTNPTLLTALFLTSNLAAEYAANDFVSRIDIPDTKSNDISLSTFIGLLSGGAINLLVKSDSPRFNTLIPLVGATIGYLWGVSSATSSKIKDKGSHLTLDLNFQPENYYLSFNQNKEYFRKSSEILGIRIGF